MNVDEPGSTGTLKFAIITGPFGEATDLADAVAVELGKKQRENRKISAQIKPKIET